MPPVIVRNEPRQSLRSKGFRYGPTLGLEKGTAENAGRSDRVFASAIRAGRSLCLSQIKSGYIGGAARRELGGKECARSARRRARPAYPSPRIDAYGPHVRQQYVTEMPLTEHNNMVKALPSDRTDESLSKSVLPWGSGDVGRSRMPIDRSLRTK